MITMGRHMPLKEDAVNVPSPKPPAPGLRGSRMKISKFPFIVTCKCKRISSRHRTKDRAIKEAVGTFCDACGENLSVVEEIMLPVWEDKPRPQGGQG